MVLFIAYTEICWSSITELLHLEQKLAAVRLRALGSDALSPLLCYAQREHSNTYGRVNYKTSTARTANTKYTIYEIRLFCYFFFSFFIVLLHLSIRFPIAARCHSRQLKHENRFLVSMLCAWVCVFVCISVRAWKVLQVRFFFVPSNCWHDSCVFSLEWISFGLTWQKTDAINKYMYLLYRYIRLKYT